MLNFKELLKSMKSQERLAPLWNGIFPSDCRPLLTKSAHGSLPGRHSTLLWALLPLCILDTGEVSQPRSTCHLLRCPLPSVAPAETHTSRPTRGASTQTSKVIATGDVTPDVVQSRAAASCSPPRGHSSRPRLCTRAGVYEFP